MRRLPRGRPEREDDLWPVWTSVQCPVLVIRGAQSDVLTADVADRMAASAPRVRLQVLAGIGHAPSLMSDDQIALISEWLSD